MWISTSLRSRHVHETLALAEPGAFRGNRPPIQSLMSLMNLRRCLDFSGCLEITIMIVEFFGYLVFIKAGVNCLHQQNPACVHIFYTKQDPQIVELAFVTCISKLTQI